MIHQQPNILPSADPQSALTCFLPIAHRPFKQPSLEPETAIRIIRTLHMVPINVTWSCYDTHGALSESSLQLRGAQDLDKTREASFESVYIRSRPHIAHLPANTDPSVPNIVLISHIDQSPAIRDATTTLLIRLSDLHDLENGLDSPRNALAAPSMSVQLWKLDLRGSCAPQSPTFPSPLTSPSRQINHVPLVVRRLPPLRRGLPRRTRRASSGGHPRLRARTRRTSTSSICRRLRLRAWRSARAPRVGVGMAVGVGVGVGVDARGRQRIRSRRLPGRRRRGSSSSSDDRAWPRARRGWRRC